MAEQLDGAEPIFDLVCDVGESPFLDTRIDRLCWVDVTGRAAYHGDLESGKYVSIALPDDVGALVPRNSGGWVAAVGRGLTAVVDDPESGISVTDLGIVVEPTEGMRLNDAIAAPDGSLWVGSMAYDHRPDVASLYRVSTGGEVRPVLTGLTLSNGLEFTADGSLLPFVDSLAGGLDVLEVASGQVVERRRIVNLDQSEGLMDGLCLDSAGGIWVAVFGAGEVRRFTFAGDCTHVVPLPARQPTCCCFAGNDLIITTAAFGLDAHARSRQPLAGRVFRIATEFAGLARSGFAG